MIFWNYGRPATIQPAISILVDYLRIRFVALLHKNLKEIAKD